MPRKIVTKFQIDESGRIGNLEEVNAELARAGSTSRFMQAADGSLFQQVGHSEPRLLAPTAEVLAWATEQK